MEKKDKIEKCKDKKGQYHFRRNSIVDVDRYKTMAYLDNDGIRIEPKNLSF